MDQPRSTQRYERKEQDDERQLVKRMLELVRERPRFGYRRIAALLRREGWSVNNKRIYRLWKKEGLRVPKKQRKKRRMGSSENACHRRRAEHKDHVWTWDFIQDRTEDKRPLKWLAIVDEYTRECLVLRVGRSLKAEDVLDTLAELFRTRGVPKHIRSDNGSEFIAHAIQRWLANVDVETLYIEPASPWENGYAESFFSRLRDELMNREVFTNLAEAEALGRAWWEDYNEQRPHSSLGYRTPAEFAATCAASVRATAAPSPSLPRHTLETAIS
jgi:putative transposase